MKVLVLNGSPKGEKSNTLNITKAFLDGFSADTEVEYITVKKETIKPCMGCFSCWSRTPGKCVIKDDMQKIYEKINSADIIIESFPLYFREMLSRTKKPLSMNCVMKQCTKRGFWLLQLAAM